MASVDMFRAAEALFRQAWLAQEAEEAQAAAEVRERDRAVALAHALEQLDPRFVEPKACRRELRRLFQSAMQIVGQLEAVMVEMAVVDRSVLDAAMVAADGYEDVADRLFVEEFGGNSFGDLLNILAGLEGVADPQVAPELTAGPRT